MRENVHEFVRLAARHLRVAGPVFEFGSYQVGGEGVPGNLRPYFPNLEYQGCDYRPGPGVDRIEDLAKLTIPDESASTIVCVDTLEHVFALQTGVGEMLRILAPGGTIIITVPFEFRIHNHPGDYWRLTPSCLHQLLSPLAARWVGWQGTPSRPHTVFAIGWKGPVAPDTRMAVGHLQRAFNGWLNQQKNKVPLPRRLLWWLYEWGITKGERRTRREFYDAEFTYHQGESHRQQGSPHWECATLVSS